MDDRVTIKPVPVHEHVDGCRWPIGEHPTLFCNGYTKDEKNSMYCAAHRKMAYVPPRSRVTRRGNKDNRNTW